jgi:tRNA 2-thiouridine synthesizing protein A
MLAHCSSTLGSSTLAVSMPGVTLPARAKLGTSMPAPAGLLKRDRDRRMPSMSETLLDVKGLNCPLPVLRANRMLRGLAPGARLRVLATDRAAVADFQAYCRETGHALLAWSEEGGVLSFLIRRRPEPDSEAPDTRDANATPSA